MAQLFKIETLKESTKFSNKSKIFDMWISYSIKHFGKINRYVFFVSPEKSLHIKAELNWEAVSISFNLANPMNKIKNEGSWEKAQ